MLFTFANFFYVSDILHLCELPFGILYRVDLSFVLFIPKCLCFHLSFSELNSIESVEYVECSNFQTY